MYMFKSGVSQGRWEWKKGTNQQSGEDQAVSPERLLFLENKKKRKNQIRFTQIFLLVFILLLWEVTARLGIIDSFIMSQPTRILKTFANLSNNDLMLHLGVTCYETLVGFLIGACGGTCIAIALWWSDFLSKVFEPFLVVLNSLPKIALGPVIIIWVGAGTNAIIVMALAISMIVTVLEMLNGFVNTDSEKLKMVKTFGANRLQTFTTVVFPSNIHTLFNSLKINIGLSLVGVIAGEFLVSKAGLGYLIVSGGQVFKLDLVMASVIILSIVAALMYQAVVILERWITRLISPSR